ncbi:acetate/propionate family kinase [Vreelandella massiliensis]|uniref:acetate/propionate family kinase n=1 Tax=Vreelandella massiliensis TaxID=1816686 RepID=UPI00096A9D0B|nr:acetate/propionate family kinase [Halomonas massiliensis]MYL24365.1 acetate/propionate family kinase [Halomonas alkaliantarctica]
MNEILVLNSGSSSLKFALYAAEDAPESNSVPALKALALHYSGHFSGIGTKEAAVSLKEVAENGETRKSDDEALNACGLRAADNHNDAITQLMTWLESRDDAAPLKGIGHRVVHGGQRFREAVVLSEDDVAELETLSSLAPLHQPHCLAPVKLLMQRYPDVPQVASFDTAFHADQPWVAKQFALPRELTQKGLIRYGFHGLSYDYINRTLPDVLPEDAARERVIVAHLGNGASLCAIHNGKSVASTMGFTALEGLVMGTRSGTLDPGLVMHLIEQEGMSTQEVSTLLYKKSGLLGVSGISSDMRELLKSDAPEAHEAIELYCYRIAREIGSLVAALGGLDQLIFTAGIGEHAARVRERVAAQCAWLGVQLDSEANARDEQGIASAESRVGVWVIPTDEERVIASDCLTLLASD